jgi:ribitol 2-dehydrogenase
MTTFKDKIAAITGAASGIGLATAEALVAAGARVVLIDRDRKALDAQCARLGPQAMALQLDLLNPAECAEILPRILEVAGDLDIFHANAGTYIGGDLLDTTLDTIDRMLNLNVNAVMKNVHSVAPHMIAKGSGDIVITASVAGHFPVPWEPVYSASKWAMTCFTQTMRRQLLKHGIRVGQVSPGPVISALLADWPEENLRKAKEAGALIEPSEVAETVMFMLSRPRGVTIRDVVILPSSFENV